MLGPVSAWVVTVFGIGKPPRRRTRHPDLLSVSQPSAVSGNEYQSKAGECKQAYHVIHQPVSIVSQCLLMPGWRAGLWRSGSSSALEALYDDELYR